MRHESARLCSYFSSVSDQIVIRVDIGKFSSLYIIIFFKNNLFYNLIRFEFNHIKSCGKQESWWYINLKHGMTERKFNVSELVAS